MNKSANESVITYANRIGARCPTCEYKLKGLTKPQCPECGKHFTLDELVNKRYAPKLHVVTGFGFLASSIILAVTIILAPLAFIYFGIAIWWAAAQPRIAEVSMGTRQVLAVIAWLPIILLTTFVLIMLVGSFL